MLGIGCGPTPRARLANGAPRAASLGIFTDGPTRPSAWRPEARANTRTTAMPTVTHINILDIKQLKQKHPLVSEKKIGLSLRARNYTTSYAAFAATLLPNPCPFARP